MQEITAACAYSVARKTRVRQKQKCKSTLTKHNSLLDTVDSIVKQLTPSGLRVLKQ